MRSVVVYLLVSFLLISSAVAQDDKSFKQSNPDVDKYEFAKSFITGLSYYSRVSDRLLLEDKESVEAKSGKKALRTFVNHRTLDNTDLRIAKNYLVKYFHSTNPLVRKVAVDSASTYDKLLELSIRERSLWQSFDRYKDLGLPLDFSEEDFAKKQVDLALEKKEVAKEMIRQTSFLTKIMLSAERCDTEDCKELALSQEERDKLSKKLDGFANGNMDWGMKSGQSTVQACVAILREILEDSLYHSRP